MPTRILIADDNQATRSSLTELLNKHDGWEVCAAVENGQQAVVKARELKPDLIILDLAMPVMDGMRATREIGQILPSVPILIYTLHDSSWLDLEAKQAGARQVVLKPDAMRLLTAIEDVLAKILPPNQRELPDGVATAAAGANTSTADANRGESPAATKGENDISIQAN
jgi:DNA-binding NarL/FixJ family response regulator